MKRRLLLSMLLTTSCIVSLNAKSDSYVGLKLSKLDTDETVFANTSGYENVGPYELYDDFSLIGIEYQKFSFKENSPFLWGMGGNLMLNNGKFFDGGMLNIDLKVGGHFDKAKAYGILGFGLHSLSEYTASTGLYFGIGATYDISDKFGVTASYTQHNMKTFSDPSDFSDKQKYKLSGFSLGALYKF